MEFEGINLHDLDLINEMKELALDFYLFIIIVWDSSLDSVFLLLKEQNSPNLISLDESIPLLLSNFFLLIIIV